MRDMAPAAGLTFCVSSWERWKGSAHPAGVLTGSDDEAILGKTDNR